MPTVKQGRLITVTNTRKHRLANDTYLAVWVEDEDGSNERVLLFTQRDIERGEHRAKMNPEDLTKKGLLQDLID